jgi:hypothetical protein
MGVDFLGYKPKFKVGDIVLLAYSTYAWTIKEILECGIISDPPTYLLNETGGPAIVTEVATEMDLILLKGKGSFFSSSSLQLY